MEQIIKYIKEKYSPEAIIVYGSFADGSANENSDFDALIITDNVKTHDASIVDGTVLDVWAYPAQTFKEEYDPDEFIQVFDGQILMDNNGTAAKLKAEVNNYISNLPLKTDEEVRQEVEWCEKMLLRTRRGDAEGFYRWHRLLVDSLEIYYDAKKLHYFGPKKALKYMEKDDSNSFQRYNAALKELSDEQLTAWISHLREMMTTKS